MQRPTRDIKAISLKKLQPKQSHRRGAEAIAHEASINAYYSAQKPTVIGQNPFDSLPSELLLNIIVGNRLPSSDARQFVHAFPSLFYKKPKLQPFLKNVNDKVRKFFLSVMNSNLEAARSMLEIDPGLILVEHSVGEHKLVTALQLAKDMGDVGMCKMLLRRLRSYDLQCSRFLDCIVDHTSTQIATLSTSKLKTPFDIKNFDLIADAIVKYPAAAAAAELARHRTGRKTELSNDMDDYRASIDLHGEFTVVDLINVFDALLRIEHKFHTLQQNDLFFLQVLGYVERKLPMCLRMTLNQGFQHLVTNSLNRDTTCIFNDFVYSFVNFTHRAKSGLGFDFAFYLSGACASKLEEEARGGYKPVPSVWLENFHRATQLELVQLMQPRSEPEVKPCVLC